MNFWTPIEHFKKKDGTIDKAAPVPFLDPTEQAAVTPDGKFRVSLYKALLFLHAQSAIRIGRLEPGALLQMPATR